MLSTLRNSLLGAAVCALALAGAASAAVFNFPLGPDQEVPPVSSGASGTGELILSGASATLNLVVMGIGTDDLMPVSSFSAIHIHQGAAGTNGPVIIDVGQNPVPQGPDGFTLSSSFNVSDLQGAAIRAGLTYVNVHTEAFNSGEIRGQIPAVPLPGAALLLGSAFIGLGAWRVSRQASST